jgi:hypothetical protein
MDSVQGTCWMPWCYIKNPDDIRHGPRLLRLSSSVTAARSGGAALRILRGSTGEGRRGLHWRQHCNLPLPRARRAKLARRALAENHGLKGPAAGVLLGPIQQSIAAAYDTVAPIIQPLTQNMSAAAKAVRTQLLQEGQLAGRP